MSHGYFIEQHDNAWAEEQAEKMQAYYELLGGDDAPCGEPWDLWNLCGISWNTWKDMSQENRELALALNGYTKDGHVDKHSERFKAVFEA